MSQPPEISIFGFYPWLIKSILRVGKIKPLPNVELGHHGEECSFDAIIKKYKLDQSEPALNELAKIV